MSIAQRATRWLEGKAGFDIWLKTSRLLETHAQLVRLEHEAEIALKRKQLADLRLAYELTSSTVQTLPAWLKTLTT